MEHISEETASREALTSGDLSPAARAADLADIRARWASRQHSSPPRRWWLYAAAIILLGFVAWSVVIYQESQQPVLLYAQYFEADNQLEYFKLRSTETSTALGTIEQTLQNGQYADALALSRRITEADPFAVQALLYQALAAMELQEFAVAGRALDQALALQMPTADRINARWYRALVHLASGEEAAARTELVWLSRNSQGQRGDKARALLAELDAN